MKSVGKHINDPIREYLKELSARKITPGGGSAAATVAAIGAALNLMVVNYSMKEDTTYGGQNEFVVLKEKQIASIKRLSDLIDEDCRVFRELMRSFKGGKGEQGKYMAAANIPMQVCRECVTSLEVTSLLLEDCNKNLLTDVGSAAHILNAAFFSADLNVRVNLKYIEDKNFVANSSEELDRMRTIIGDVAKEIGGRVKNALAV